MGGAVAYVSRDGSLRVVEGLNGRPVVELAEGDDAAGDTRWGRAIVQPDKYENGLIYLEGWPEITPLLGVTDETALAWARRPVDPLPVRRSPTGRPIIPDILVRAWVTNQTLPERLFPYVAHDVVRIPLAIGRNDR